MTEIDENRIIYEISSIISSPIDDSEKSRKITELIASNDKSKIPQIAKTLCKHAKLAEHFDKLGVKPNLKDRAIDIIAETGDIANFTKICKECYADKMHEIPYETFQKHLSKSKEISLDHISEFNEFFRDSRGATEESEKFTAEIMKNPDLTKIVKNQISTCIILLKIVKKKIEIREKLEAEKTAITPEEFEEKANDLFFSINPIKNSKLKKLKNYFNKLDIQEKPLKTREDQLLQQINNLPEEYKTLLNSEEKRLSSKLKFLPIIESARERVSETINPLIHRDQITASPARVAETINPLMHRDQITPSPARVAETINPLIPKDQIIESPDPVAKNMNPLYIHRDQITPSPARVAETINPLYKPEDQIIESPERVAETRRVNRNTVPQVQRNFVSTVRNFSNNLRKPVSRQR